MEKFMTCHFIVYNVKLGQCIGVLPASQRDYAMLVDCGHDDSFHPIDDFQQYLTESSEKPPRPVIRTLFLTNYDHDHFSGLPKLRKTVQIRHAHMPDNLSMQELRDLKEQSTAALDALDDMRRTYTSTAQNYTPPLEHKVFSLTQAELRQAQIPVQTNHLSQIVFFKYRGVTLCIPGDLEDRSWAVMLTKLEVKNWLQETNIFIASHHGRENGYHPDIFKYCRPSCVIFSDKSVIHDTQKDMAATYSKHVIQDGVEFSSATGGILNRKVLTTRNDGHILITVDESGGATFKAHTL
jgi:hypothetical protein